jgi:ABC-type branched-subunit amino acid transport system substrate-binding protein
VSKARVRQASVLLLLVIIATACGARVSDQQLRAAGVQAGSQTGTGVNPSSGGDVSGVGGGSETGPSGGDATASPEAGPGGDTPGGPSTAQGGTANPATAAPEGGNGGATDIGVTGDTITLGNVSTLSGPVPGLFQGAVIGTQAVVAYQNSLGGMFGRTFKLVVRDDQLDTGQNRTNTIDLLNKVFAFVGSFSLYDDAAAKEIEQSGIVDTTYSLNPGRRALPNNFSPASAPPRGAPTGQFNYFKKRFPDAITKVGTLYTELAKPSHDDYKAAAQSVGYRYVYERPIQATETDFTADVVRMRQQGVKFVFLIAVDEKTVARVAKAMAQQSFKPEAFVVGGPAYHPNTIPLAGAAVEGMYNAQPYAMFDGEDAAYVPEVKLFNEWLQKVKPGYKPDLFAAYGWAAGRLFFQALEAAGPKAKRADVLAALKKIDRYDDHGMLAETGPATKRPAECFIVTQVKGGKWQRVDSPPPGFRCGDGTYLTP